MKEQDLSYYTFKCANELGMMLYYKHDINIIKDYVDEIIKISNLYDVEQTIWNMVYKTIKITNEFNLINVKNIFMDNRLLSDEELEELDNENIADRLDETFNYYKRLYERKQLLDKLETAVDCFNVGRDIDINEVISSIERFNDTTGKIENTVESLEEKYDEEQDKTIISTAIERIDNSGADFMKGTINTVFAYTGSFKTMYCTNVAYKAMCDGLNVCYLSLEISEENMYYNFLSRYSNEEKFNKTMCHVDMKRRKLQLEDKEYVFKTVLPAFTEELSKHLIVLDECTANVDNYLELTILLKKVDDEFIKRTEKGVDLVIIDHINLMKFNQTNNMNDYSKVNHWMSFFRKNSMNFVGRKKPVCFLVAAQSSRNGYEYARKHGGVYTLDGIAEGNEIERASTTVISIYTDAELKKSKCALMQVLKGRDCEEMTEPIVVSVLPQTYLLEDKGEVFEHEDFMLHMEGNSEDLEDDYEED